MQLFSGVYKRQMIRSQKCLFLVDRVSKTSSDTGSLPFHQAFSSFLLRNVGACVQLASAPVRSTVALETKHITMETQDSL